MTKETFTFIRPENLIQWKLSPHKIDGERPTMSTKQSIVSITMPNLFYFRKEGEEAEYYNYKATAVTLLHL